MVCQMSSCAFDSKRKAPVLLGQSIPLENPWQGFITYYTASPFVLEIMSVPLKLPISIFKRNVAACINSFILFLEGRIPSHPL